MLRWEFQAPSRQILAVLEVESILNHGKYGACILWRVWLSMSTNINSASRSRFPLKIAIVVSIFYRSNAFCACWFWHFLRSYYLLHRNVLQTLSKPSLLKPWMELPTMCVKDGYISKCWRTFCPDYFRTYETSNLHRSATRWKKRDAPVVLCNIVHICIIVWFSTFCCQPQR